MGRFSRAPFGKLIGALALLLATTGCERETSEKELSTSRERAEVVPAPSALRQPSVPGCERQAKELAELEQLPGTPLLDEHRAELLARARAVPVVFSSAPFPPPGLSSRVREFREKLKDAEYPAEAIQKVLHETRGRYLERRAIFLTEQYLFAQTPLLALRLSQIIRLDHLFNEDKLVIQRGDELITVKRHEGRYYLPPDPNAPARRGKKPEWGGLASLLLFDRVRIDTEPFGRRLHFDLSPLQRQLGFSKAQIIAFLPDRLALMLDTHGVQSYAVFSGNFAGSLPRTADPLGEAPAASAHPAFGDKTRDEPEPLSPSLLCETVRFPHVPADLRQARENALLDQKLIAPVLLAAREMIERRLPFDEPRTEEGQQDGLLRLHFREAYRRYRDTFEFNGDSYYVFDGYGRARLPQVCIDFITDAFDWGTGGYWPGRGEKRLRRRGALHIAGLGIENPRSIESLAEYASATPAWFDVIWFDRGHRVKFRHREKFFEKLARDADLYRPGDVVFIYGLRDDGKFHYHSFMIDQKDPITGMPILVMANAGPPQARSWEGEMQNAPLRSIVARMRVRRHVLAQALEQAKLHPGVPLEAPPTDYEIPDKKAESEPSHDAGLPEL